MFKKTLCLIALAAVAFTQEVTNQQVNDAINQAVQAAQTTTVGQAVAQVQAAAQAQGANNVNVNQIDSSVPALNSLTIGYGNREVVVTPQAANPTLNDWIQGQSNVARENADWANGEWALQWSVENGDNYALLHDNNDDFIIVDTTTNTRNNWGANDALDAEVASGAQQLVNYVYDNEVNMIDGNTITNWFANVLNNDNVNNFLQNNNDETVAQAASNAANELANSNPGAAASVNQAVANAGNQDVSGSVAGAINSALSDVQNAGNGAVANAANQVASSVQGSN